MNILLYHVFGQGEMPFANAEQNAKITYMEYAGEIKYI